MVVIFPPIKTMTQPVKRAMRNSRGFNASIDVSVDSPRQIAKHQTSQNVNVNIVSPLTKDREFVITTSETDLKPEIEDLERQPVDLVGSRTVKPPQSDCVDIKERSIDSAFKDLDEMNDIVKDKNCLIQALALIIDLYESNPLIVNKCIVAEEETLARLLLLLTDGDEVEIVKKDFEVGCVCKNPPYELVDKIIVHKNGEIYNLKYSYPNVIRLLDNRRITYKVVC